jgi:hypothetical protein
MPNAGAIDDFKGIGFRDAGIDERLVARVVPEAFAQTEGAGNAGRPPRPQPRVVKKTRELVTTVVPGRPAFPAQWF